MLKKLLEKVNIIGFLPSSYMIGASENEKPSNKADSIT